MVLCCGGHGADDQAGVDGAVIDGERVEQCADGAAASRTTASGSQASQAQLHRHRLRAAWAKRQSPRACRRPDPRDRGVDVAPAGRGRDVEDALAVEPDRTQLRLPAPGEQRASRQQNRRGGALARADGQRKWHHASAGAESTESGRLGSGHRARAASCSMCTGLARAAAGPTEAAPRAWRPTGLRGTPGMVSWAERRGW